MTADRSTIRRRLAVRRGLTLVEMVLSTVLVSIALVAALNTVGAAKLGQTKTSTQRQGFLLAQDLMAEILLLDYEEPVDTPGFGTEPAEGGGSRRLYDDVDDYNGWSSAPPEYKDGTVIPNRDGWERSVSVALLNPVNLAVTVVADLGVKGITVSVTYNGVLAAELVALKTIGLPPLEACCFQDGTCQDLRIETCATVSGTSMGPDTSCANTECASGIALLFVVTDVNNLTAQELARQTLVEGWDFSVTLIADSEPQAQFDSALADADVAYVSEQADAVQIGTKLNAAAIGVVNENAYMIWNLQLTAGDLFTVSASGMVVHDNSHYITSPFALEAVYLTGSYQPMITFFGLVAPGVVFLANLGPADLMLATIEAGATLADGSPAAGRRVQLPWGYIGFDITALNANGQGTLQRALEWAAGMEVVVVCGDGTCDVGEGCSCPADCGTPAASELIGLTCDDGLDNDCDGTTDCADINCTADPACACAPKDGPCTSGGDCCSGNCNTGKGKCK